MVGQSAPIRTVSAGRGEHPPPPYQPHDVRASAPVRPAATPGSVRGIRGRQVQPLQRREPLIDLRNRDFDRTETVVQPPNVRPHPADLNRELRAQRDHRGQHDTDHPLHVSTRHGASIAHRSRTAKSACSSDARQMHETSARWLSGSSMRSPALRSPRRRGVGNRRGGEDTARTSEPHQAAAPARDRPGGSGHRTPFPSSIAPLRSRRRRGGGAGTPAPHRRGLAGHRRCRRGGAAGTPATRRRGLAGRRRRGKIRTSSGRRGRRPARTTADGAQGTSR